MCLHHHARLTSQPLPELNSRMRSFLNETKKMDRTKAWVVDDDEMTHFLHEKTELDFSRLKKLDWGTNMYLRSKIWELLRQEYILKI